ncbi:MAG: UvrD-helicase domain-containing protein [Deltaproteobacteria bacterium]|nr:UvrD-helicase domain-containing protein [Deltaproteobacteria bacterium]
MNNCSIVLSAEQRAAILTPGNVLVRAGAGSGKTEVLARRFVALIAGEIEGRPAIPPAQIAAITFTEKAAYDMRARIAAVLEQCIQAQSDSEHRAHLLAARAQLPVARISTIHAFCSRILRENAVEAALDPDFQVLDEYESRTFLERICTQFLIDKVRGLDPGACYLAMARHLDSATPREGAVSIAMRILDEVARLGRTPQWLCDATRDAAVRFQGEASGVELLGRELSRLLDQLLSVRGLSDAAEQTIARLRIRHREFRDRILAINAQVEPEAVGFLREFCEYLPQARGRLHGCVASIKKIVLRGAGRFGLDGELISLYGACRAFPRALEIGALIRELALRFQQAKADERLLTFDDLLVCTRELFERNAAARLRYKGVLRALLVDEFQDTDPIQHEIVARLVEPEAGGHPPELFVVGDEKQSIYRFRGADVAGFSRLKQRLGPLPMRVLPLLGNRRSSANIVAFVNGLGAALMHAPDQPVPPYWVEWGREHELSALRSAALNPPVEIMVAGDWPRESNAAANSAGLSDRALRVSAAHKRALEVRALASRINRLVGTEMITDLTSRELRPVRYRDIVVLLRAFTDVAIYEAALLDAAVPCYTVKGRGFFGCQEVLDTTELLTAVDDPGDSLALAAALRSPFFGLSDDCLAQIALHRELADANREQRSEIHFPAAFAAGGPAFSWLSDGRDDAIGAWRILDDLRKLRQRGTIVGVLEQALAATSYEAVMLGLRQGPQRVANVHKLIELARDFESRRFFTFHDFVVHLRRLVEQQPYEPPAQILGESENVVRLMTVHQAKGLEFPVVFLADAGRRPDNDNRSPVVDPENGLLLRDAVGSGMDEIPNKILADFRKRSGSEQEAESLRLLYVALTRARDRLIISEGAMVQGWAKQIRSFVGEEFYSAFCDSSNERQLVERADAQIVLIRPDPAQARRDLRLASGSPTDAITMSALARRRLSFEPPYSHELVISPTALADFERCPRQFQFRHRLRLAEPLATDDGTRSALSVMGTVAHAVLERLEFAAANEDEIQQLVNAVGIAAGLTSNERMTIAADMVRCMAKLATGPPGAREVPFFYHVGDGLFLRGQIDALLQERDRVVVRDYKYARASDHLFLYQLAMEAYALAVAEAHPQSSVEAQLVFLKDGGETVSVALPPISEIRAHILSLGRGIIAAQKAGDFPKKPTGANACRRLRCGFVKHCWADSV